MVFCTFIGSGCQFGEKPRIRFGTYPSSTIGATFLSAEQLGPHGYYFDLGEKDGLVYTCRGGHIDIAHVRIAADWTRYIAKRSYKCIMEGERGFSFVLTVEPSVCYVQIEYPPNWEELRRSQKKAIARKMSIEIGEYAAYSITTWHEILTWFGYKCIAFLPEFPSAFSWEDSYSNLLGVRLAGDVLSSADNLVEFRSVRYYEKGMAKAIERELDKLGAQPARVAIAASEKVRNKWFSGPCLFMVDMRMRNFDTGLDDGFITPTLVPDISECGDTEAQSYPVPDLEFAEASGFTVKVEIEPREWERGKILNIANGAERDKKRRIDPRADFVSLLSYMYHQASSGGYMLYPSVDSWFGLRAWDTE